MTQPNVVALLGYGSIGQRHAKNVSNFGWNVKIYDPEIFPKIRLKDVLKDAQAAIIASPTSLHREHIEAVADAGLSCFVEKPLAHELFLGPLSHIRMVGYNLRFNTVVGTAKQWLADGKIGDPIWAHIVCAQLNTKPAYLRDGVVLNWSHEIDLAHYFLGAGDVTGATIRHTDGNEDLADILIQHDNGCLCHVHLDYLTHPEVRGFDIIGTKGKLSGDLKNGSVRVYKTKGIYQELYLGETSFDGNYQLEIKTFLNSLENGDIGPGATAEDGIQALKTCLEAKNHESRLRGHKEPHTGEPEVVRRVCRT